MPAARLDEPAFLAGAAPLVTFFAPGIARGLAVLETDQPAADQLPPLFHGLYLEWQEFKLAYRTWHEAP